MAANPMPEYGAKEDNSLSKQSGNKQNVVTVSSAVLRGSSKKGRVNAGSVSANTMLYVVTDETATKTQAQAGIHELRGSTVRAQACR
mmetsp:Transcript_11819/g.32782  ORF Transcript_11819/g.32782 Transcript_11819/m.32782 type:complete len:87 (-) Transcript_11819:523-783(-)